MSFIGTATCDVIPPKSVYIYMTVLPENTYSKLLIQLNAMSRTWCSVELKQDIEMGYAITTIHAGFKYNVITGLMNKYVEFVFKNKTCTSGVKPAEECYPLHESHPALGL
jgi:hypothetical protein